MASGYDVSNYADIENRFLCPICLLVIRRAVQTACGHRFCEGCLSRVTKCGPGSLFRCPVDKTLSNRNQVFPDVATQREILCLRVGCNKAEEGCAWTGEVRHFETHLEQCPYEEMACPNKCGEQFSRRDKDVHAAECPAREVQCEHCSAEVVYSALEKHLEDCPKMMVTCPVCRQVELLREEMRAHTDASRGDCPLVHTSCPYSFLGCQFAGERRRVMEHISQVDVLQQHLGLAAAVISSHTDKMATMQETIDKLKAKTDEIVPTVMSSQRRLGQISRDLRDRNVTGRLQWKVKLRGYNRGRNTSYCSPTFYTGCPGYKVQLTLNMEGFREGREWYVSLSLGLLPGEYDDSVVFPFNATCDVTLLDQSENVRERHNSEQQIVVRHVPRNGRVGHSNFSNTHKRSINKYMSRRNLIGPESRFMRNGCLHFEVRVIHSVVPSPDCAATATTAAALLCSSTPTSAAASALPRTLLLHDASLLHVPQQTAQQQQQQQQAGATPVTSASNTPTNLRQAARIMGVATLSINN